MARKEVIVPKDSQWEFIRFMPRIGSNGGLAEFKCIDLLKDGSICGNVRVMNASEVRTGRSLRCKGSNHANTTRLRGIGAMKGIEGLGIWSRHRARLPLTEDEIVFVKTKQRAAIIKWNTENSDRLRQYVQEYRSSTLGRARFMLNAARHSKAVSKRGLPLDIDVPWIQKRLEGGVCEALGIPFDFTPARAPNRPNMFSPSLDRRDSRLGYTKDNVRVVVWIYNQLKSDYQESEVDEFLRLVSSMSL